MKFALVGEGPTDYYVIRNILIGFFNDKNIALTLLHPEDAKKPGGWSNVLGYIQTESFQKSFLFNDYVIIQIDTRECDQWKQNLVSIGSDEKQVTAFIDAVIKVLIGLIGTTVYDQYKDKII